jgi:hypothetical protein
MEVVEDSTLVVVVVVVLRIHSLAEDRRLEAWVVCQVDFQEGAVVVDRVVEGDRGSLVDSILVKKTLLICRLRGRDTITQWIQLGKAQAPFAFWVGVLLKRNVLWAN